MFERIRYERTLDACEYQLKLLRLEQTLFVQLCMISCQIMQYDPKLLGKKITKDPVLTQVVYCVKEGWPNQFSDKLQDYKKLDDSLSIEHDCL